jgi:hypothetical protein
MTGRDNPLEASSGKGTRIRNASLDGKHFIREGRNEACAFCHMPGTGFTGPISELNRTTCSYPGSVRTRYSERKRQSHAYAPLRLFSTQDYLK